MYSSGTRNSGKCLGGSTGLLHTSLTPLLSHLQHLKTTERDPHLAANTNLDEGLPFQDGHLCKRRFSAFVTPSKSLFPSARRQPAPQPPTSHENTTKPVPGREIPSPICFIVNPSFLSSLLGHPRPVPSTRNFSFSSPLPPRPSPTSPNIYSSSARPSSSLPHPVDNVPSIYDLKAMQNGKFPSLSFFSYITARSKTLAHTFVY